MGFRLFSLGFIRSSGFEVILKQEITSLLVISFKIFLFRFPSPNGHPALLTAPLGPKWPHTHHLVWGKGDQDRGLPRHASLTFFWGPAPESLGKTLNTHSRHFIPSPSLRSPGGRKRVERIIRVRLEDGRLRQAAGRRGPSQTQGSFWHQRSRVRTQEFGCQVSELQFQPHDFPQVGAFTPQSPLFLICKVRSDRINSELCDRKSY